MADRVQLQQVFMNLMRNAIEAMRGTGGEDSSLMASRPLSTVATWTMSSGAAQG
jgi:C4-dicarboxylate-specific signal transduction histidine kinase